MPPDPSETDADAALYSDNINIVIIGQRLYYSDDINRHAAGDAPAGIFVAATPRGPMARANSSMPGRAERPAWANGSMPGGPPGLTAAYRAARLG